MTQDWLGRCRKRGMLVSAFVRLGRPQFLLGGFVLYGLGACWAFRVSGHFDAAAFAWGQATITAAQLMTHYANDYFDIEVDRANATPTRWSGGSRVLVAGLLPPNAAKVAALIFAALSFSFAVLSWTRAAVPAQAALTWVAIISLAWAYSAPPFRLVARGLGELATALVVTLLTPWWAARLQTAVPLPGLTLVLLPLAVLQIGMLFAINCADADGDAQTGKRTLVVLLGRDKGMRFYQGLLLAWVALLPAIHAGLGPDIPRAILAPLLVCAPVALWQVASLQVLRRSAAISWEGLALRGVGMLFLTAAAVLAMVAWVSWKVAL